eukprot:scaffold48277_cov19-Prasinocladus_malaysianus.AAC.1
MEIKSEWQVSIRHGHAGKHTRKLVSSPSCTIATQQSNKRTGIFLCMSTRISLAGLSICLQRIFQ